MHSISFPPPLSAFPIFPNLDTQSVSVTQNPQHTAESLFAEDIWKKISDSSKKCLKENNFSFPRDLTGDYRYFDLLEGMIVIDFGTSLGHARLGKIRFGQNLTTAELLAFKTIAYNTDTIDHFNMEVIGLTNLRRLKGLILDQKEQKVYMAMELINGVTSAEYSWKEHSKDIAHAIRLAISYLDELEYVASCKVAQSDQNPRNIMIDLKKNKVFLIDFAGGMFDYKTKTFKPDPNLPYLNIADMMTIIDLLPKPFMLEDKQMLTESYNQFYSSLLKRKEQRKEENFYCLTTTIDQLRNELSKFLTTLK